MKIQIESLLIERENRVIKRIGNDNRFVVKELKFNVDPQNLKVTDGDSEILKCLKYCIKENKNVIDYLEIRELIDTTNIIWNNFCNEEEFNRACNFEFRNCFNLEECKYVYSN